MDVKQHSPTQHNPFLYKKNICHGLSLEMLCDDNSNERVITYVFVEKVVEITFELSSKPGRLWSYGSSYYLTIQFQGFVKVVKNKQYFKRFQVKFRRRRGMQQCQWMDVFQGSR